MLPLGTIEQVEDLALKFKKREQKFDSISLRVLEEILADNRSTELKELHDKASKMGEVQSNLQGIESQFPTMSRDERSIPLQLEQHGLSNYYAKANEYMSTPLSVVVDNVDLIVVDNVDLIRENGFGLLAFSFPGSII